jgi:hypothetical protein
MPEIKHNFTGGRMNKDLDERLVPNGEYRDAMNIQVSTSEGSEVGTVQNILGNAKIQMDSEALDSAMVISSIADEKNDTLYYLIWSPDVDYILSYKRGDTTTSIIFRDVNKNALKFDPRFLITGINIIDDMLFWTDNNSEPKKINISRCRAGTPPSTPTIQTKLVNNSTGIASIDIEEKHITVIKKTPTIPLEMKLGSLRDPNKIYTGVITTTILGFNFNSVTTEEGSNMITASILDGVDAGGNVIPIGAVGDTAIGLTGWHKEITETQFNRNVKPGLKVVFKPFDDDGTPPGLPVTDFVLKGVVVDRYPLVAATTSTSIVAFRITSIDGSPPLPDVAQDETLLKYVVDVFEEAEKLFEFKFPRFSYRYKYEDGEYSPFAPFTQVAFLPGSFDYHPRKGYNIGMTNKLAHVELGGFIHDKTPEDVVSVDILFKDEPSPNIYIVDTIRPDDFSLSGTPNAWDNVKVGNYYKIDSETINSVVPSNQLLRPWDSVPRKALAQDVTGNRVVYGNYVQNYNLLSVNGDKFVPDFNFKWGKFSGGVANANKSIKSLREYQLGVVFTDKYGRETPVISNPSGTKKLEKGLANSKNRIHVGMVGNNFPQNLTHFKFFVKETADQYYNMAMDRWYEAEDGNVWLAFPSSDRNKLDIDTFLILKKGADDDTLVSEAARYKVLAIENEAPDFIKTDKSIVSNENAGADIFDSLGPEDLPLEGSKDFKLNFAGYAGTSGQNVHLIEDQLYVSFGVVGGNEESDRYKISSVATDWAGGSDLLAIDGVSEAKFSIKLDEPLASDVNFIANSSGVKNTTVVNIWRYKVENKPQFDGRFFVKIYKDEVFKNSISKSLEYVEPEYRVTASKKLYSMKEDNIQRHTSDLNRNFTSDINSGLAGYGSANLNEFGNQNSVNEAKFAFGYYLNDQFTSCALYFRRYRKIPRDAAEITANKAPLIHLSKSGSIGNGVTYLGETWHDKADGNLELPDRAGIMAVAGNSASDAGGYTGNWGSGGYNGFWEYAGGAIKIGDSDLGAKETEVWFVDAGPVRAYRTSGYDLSFPGLSTVEYPATDGATFYSQNNTTWDRGPRDGLGVYPTLAEPGLYNSTSGLWNLSIGYGGILGSKTWREEPSEGNSDSDFFNVGGWLEGEPVNTSYKGSEYTEFVKKLHAGYQFRWKEDPDQTIYTIDDTSSAFGGQNLRHSSYLGDNLNYPGSSNDLISFVQNSYTANINTFPYAHSMAERLSFNYTKTWDIRRMTPALAWNPYTAGAINPSGYSIKIPAAVDTSSATCTFNFSNGDLKIFVGAIVDSTDDTKELKVGMALSRYTVIGGSDDTLQNHLSTDANEFLVIRDIEKKTGYYELLLGGWDKPSNNFDHQITNTHSPVEGSNYTFVQVGMNGYSHNSEFNINTMNLGPIQNGNIGAVGYTIEFLEVKEKGEFLSENPAIWETEPKDVKDLDIYYEATGAIPIEFDASNIHEAIPIGSTINNLNVTGYIDHQIMVDNVWDLTLFPIIFGAEYLVVRPDGLEFMCTLVLVNNVPAIPQIGLPAGAVLEITPNLYNAKFKLPWHNCYSFGNGVESNRIRDNFNLPYIANGVKVSTTLDQEYKEEHRKYGLIYSGLYNSISGVNNLNQFIAAEKITKDINPIYGSIQKLHSRDSDLVTLCEDKCLRILANKDAVFNAGGNTNLTATENVLGQTIPFSGEYGISTNPESFASESYRVYFADKIRGAVMRLSKDGLTPISNHGMKDWFKDNLKLSNKIIGSYDDKKDEYNITLKHLDYTTVPLDAEYSTDSVTSEIAYWDGTIVDCYKCVGAYDRRRVISQTFNINEFDSCPSGWSEDTDPCAVDDDGGGIR